MAKEQTPKWVTDLISAGIRAAGNTARLAEAIQISPSNFINYETGTVPNAAIVDRLLRFLGGDINRAMPDWIPDIEPKLVPVFGQVQAGSFSQTGDSMWDIPLDLTPWKDGPHYTLTVGEVGLVQVVGDSMEPRYSPGEFLICRRPADWKNLPDLTPCIFTSNAGSTFKLLRHTNKGKVVGQPLNPNHEIIELDGRDVSVQLVVLGSVDLGYTKTPAHRRKRK